MLTLPPTCSLNSRRLDPRDAPAVQALLEECRDYHQLVSGLPASPEEAQRLFSELPPGKSARDKIVTGFFLAQQRLCGVLDLVRDFRQPGEWYLGLLLFEPAARRQRHGAAVLHALLAWLRAENASLIRLGCAQQNTAGRRFWERHGFRAERSHPPRTIGVRQTVLIELVLPV